MSDVSSAEENAIMGVIFGHEFLLDSIFIDNIKTNVYQVIYGQTLPVTDATYHACGIRQSLSSIAAQGQDIRNGSQYYRY